jgi:hypothetical protein
MPTPLSSHEASRHPQNKQTQPQSPNRPAKATNQQINRFFSAIKPNQSTSPGRSKSVEQLSPTQDPSSHNYYSSLDTGVEEEKEGMNKGQEMEVFYNTLDTGTDEGEKGEVDAELEMGSDGTEQADDPIASDSPSDHSSTDSTEIVHLIHQPPPMPGLDPPMTRLATHTQASTGLPTETRARRMPQNPYQQQPNSGRGGGILHNITTPVNPRSPKGRGLTGAATSTNRGIIQGASQPPTRLSGPKNNGWDFDIKLKRGLLRNNIFRYDLRFKVKSTTVEEEAQVATHRVLSEFFNILLQADDSIILPPYLELDRISPGINDLSSSYFK